MPKDAFFNPSVPANQSSKPMSEQVLENQSETQKRFARLVRITEGKAPLANQTEGFQGTEYMSSLEYFQKHAMNPNFRPGNSSL
jgi:hypothetical protein